MSFIRYIQCITPFRYYSLCPSFRAQSFRNWYSSFCRECVLRPCQIAKRKRVPYFNLKKGKQQVFETLCFVKKKKGRWMMNKIWLFYAVFSFWPFKDLLLHTRTYIKNPLKSFLNVVYFCNKEICCIFQICCILCLLFDAKYLFFS
jgi:hypothetical protein